MSQSNTLTGSIKKNNVLIKVTLLFIINLLNTSLYAKTNNDIVYLTNSSLKNISCAETDCFFPQKTPIADHDIYVDEQVEWNRNENLVLLTKKDIVFKKKGGIVSKKNGSISLKAGMEPEKKNDYDSTVVFENEFAQIEMLGEGQVKIYYNPQRGNRKHKYHNPNFYKRNVIPIDKVTYYMLVNDVDDLQHISKFLSGNYALSQNIDASETQSWAKGKGFRPMGGKRATNNKPFSGKFDGNNYTISNLYINRPEEDNVGLFAFTSGHALSDNTISNLNIDQAHIVGNFRVGILIAEGIGTNLNNINVKNSTIDGYGPVGILAGSLQQGISLAKDMVKNISIDKTTCFCDKNLTEKVVGMSIIFAICENSKNE